jgi:hypothetical protein
MFVCDRQQGLVGIADDPRPLLGDLPDKYDLAVRVNVQEIPARQREKMIERINQRAAEDLRRRLGEDKNQHTARKILQGHLSQAAVVLAQDAEHLTLGWNLDQPSGHAALEVEVDVREDSKSASALNQWSSSKTRFGGFRLPHAVFSSTFVATSDSGMEAPLDKLITAVRAKAFDDIDLGETTADQARAGKALVDGFLEIIQETLATGRVDEVTSLALNPDAATLIAARYVADGAKVTKTLQQLVAAVRQEHPDVVDQSLAADVDEVHGVRLHRVTMDVPAEAKNRDVVVRMMGPSLEIVVGIGPQIVCIAAGRDAMPALKEALERSREISQAEGPPLELSVAVRDVAKLVAEFGQGPERDRAERGLRALEAATGGRDRIRLSVEPSARSVKLRLQVDEGVLTMLRPPPAA